MAARSLLLSTLVLVLQGWTCAQTINLQVSAIPTTATRLISVVDQGGLLWPIRFVKDISAGVSTSTFSVAVPAGGPYRVRTIAFTSGLAYPAILRSGKVTGVLVPNGSAGSASIALAGLTAALDASTPASAPAGSTATLAANITDPGDTGAGASTSSLYNLTTPMPGNQLGNDRVGLFERIGNGVYRLTATMATPPTGTTLNYQFAFNAWDFNDANKVEQPHWFWPNLIAGGAPLLLASQPSSSISLTVLGLPALGHRIVAVVDGAALQCPVRVVKDYTTGQTSTAMTAEVPAGSAYRIRVVTYAAGSVFPAILRTGKATALTAPGSTAVALSDPVFTPSASNPVSASAGSTLTLEASLVDTGETLAGMPVASLYSRTISFTTNLDGTERRGLLEGLGSGNYHVSVPMTLPSTAATTYYQFAANAFDFNNPSGLESPHICWPNLQAGQALVQVASTQTSAIRVTISGTPATATSIIAVVDQGGLPAPVRTTASFTAGSPPANITIGVPPGGPYRVRLIAVKSGSSTPVILRAGKATGINVSAGATATAAVTLSDYTVTIDPTTPSSGFPSSIVTVIANATDLGDTASGASAARLYGASSTFTQNMSVAPLSGLVEKNADGTMKLTAPAVLPALGSTLYYQLAFEAVDFRDTDGMERPYFCWPNVEAAQPLKQIATSSTQNLYTISGTVKLNGAALSGVAVGLTGAGSGSVETGADGSYSFPLLPAGSYTVTAVRSNFTFSPASTVVALSANRTVDFTATQIAGTISLTLTGLPPAGNRIVAVVDGATLPVPMRLAMDYTPGQASTVLSFDASAVSGYRIRVVAFAAGGLHPSILRTGQVTSVAAPSTPSVLLADPTFTPLAGTPSSAAAGSTVTLGMTLVDPGNAVAAVAVASIYSQVQSFTANMSGTESRGVLSSLGSNSYRLSVPLTLPATAVTSYYQFAANAFAFNDPSGTESPYFFWPDPQSGQALRQIQSTLPTAIRITISGAPAAATRLISVVDQGGLAQPIRTVASFPAGQAPTTITVVVPTGVAFRVRVIAIRSGASTPVILRAGKVSGVNVPANTTVDAAVSLSDYGVSLDPSVPISGAPGASISVIANSVDPGETASSGSVLRVYSSLVPFTENMAAASTSGLIEINSGNMKLSAPVTLGGSGAVLYYQLAFEAPDFKDSNGTERPFFCWPNLEATQSLNRIATFSVFAISGKVTASGAPLSGVTLTLAGTATSSAVTGADGTYAFTFLPAGSYTVTASRSYFAFAPSPATVSLTTNQTVDFTATPTLATISAVLTGLPPTGNRIVAIVDGAGLPVPLRVIQAYTSGQTSASISLDAPPMSGYRIRAVAFAAGDLHPSILRSGQTVNVSAPSSVTVPLAVPTFTPLAGNPTSAAAGSAVNLELTLIDSGNAIGAVAVSSVFSQSQTFTRNLSGTEARGTVTLAGPSAYRLSVPFTLPATAVTTYYQFVVNAFDFNDPAGTESPCYFWPDPQSGQTLAQIASTLPTGIRILVSGTPATATRLIAVTDQGALTQPIRTVATFTAGQAPASITVGVPIGSSYRVRVIAIRSGSANPIILRSGKAAGISVAPNATVDAAVALTDYTASLDPLTPTSALPGSTITVITNVTDPGDTGAGTSVSTLVGGSTVFTQNLSATAAAGTLENPGSGTLKLANTLVLPAAGSAFYFQLSYEALDFVAAGEAERPLFCWPNLEAAQVLKQIVLSPVYKLSGKVTLNGVARSGVSVSLSGLRSSTVVTGADGAYLFAGLPAGSYTVAASRTNFTFSPASSTITLASDRTVNFSVTQVSGTITVSRSALRFGATVGGSSTTTTQDVAVDVSDNLPVSWTVTPDQAWLRTTPAGGTGSGSFTVSLNSAAIPPAGIATGKITLNTNTTTSAQLIIQVYLAVSPSTGAPFGVFETPASGPTILGSSVPVTGWALDDVGVKKVEVWREPVPKEPVHPNGLVYIGDATFVPDARPDVAALYFDKPNNYRAGWGYMMLTNFLPNPTGGPSGNGTFKLHAIAVDEEGKRTELGVKTITVNNASAIKPFGTIDSPWSGEVVSGTYKVIGWALTPQPHKVAESGQDIWVAIDGKWVANVSYNGYRSDIAALFPTYANAGGSEGTLLLDTTRFPNGMHNIAWAVTDSAGRTDGIGSRYFFIRNTTPAAVLDPTPIVAMSAVDASKGADIEVEELGRVELQLPRGSNWTGRLVYNDDRTPLPVGSTLDGDGGAFVWQMGPGFLGQYRLEFTNGSGESKTVRVVVRPLGSTADLPKERQIRF